MAWRLHPYRLPLARAYAWAGGRHTERVGALVSRDGGWGEVAYPPGAPFDAANVAAVLRAADEDLAAVSDPRIRCGMQTAALDAEARQQGRRLCDMLGPARDSVAVNWLVVGDDVEAQVREAQALGIEVFKLKCSADRRRDIERVALLREAAPNAKLRLDANGSWSASWARPHMEQLAAFSIEYVEQPLPAADEAAMVHLAAHAPFPVALDEAATDAAAIRRLLGAGAGHIVILKPQRLGGPQATVAAMDVARHEGARAIVTNSLETSIGVHAALHCAAVLPEDEACGLATNRFFARDVAPAPRIKDGRMQVPSGAGLGVRPEAPMEAA